MSGSTLVSILKISPQTSLTGSSPTHLSSLTGKLKLLKLCSRFSDFAFHLHSDLVLNLLSYIRNLSLGEVVFIRIKPLDANTKWIVHFWGAPLARFSLGSSHWHWNYSFEIQLIYCKFNNQLWQTKVFPIFSKGHYTFSSALVFITSTNQITAFLLRPSLGR